MLGKTLDIPMFGQVLIENPEKAQFQESSKTSKAHYATSTSKLIHPDSSSAFYGLPTSGKLRPPIMGIQGYPLKATRKPPNK